ncbi:MAG: magnesium/cobalt transporter CorA [Cyanobacteriota bacterium]
MLDNLQKRTEKTGLPPGTMSYIGPCSSEEISFELIEYNDDIFNEFYLNDIDEFSKYFNNDSNKWLNIKGIHNTESIKTLGNILDINSLTLEDIVNTSLFPKIEFYDNYIFIVLKLITFNNNSDNLTVEQVSIVLGNNYVLTFQENNNNLFLPVINRLKNNSLFKKKNCDYLTYTIIDLIIDQHFETMANIGNRIEELEDIILLNPDNTLLSKINNLKSKIILLRSYFRPKKNLIITLERLETSLIDKSLHIYLRDVSDHINQLNEIVDIYRETVTHLLDIYLSSANNKMSETMKVLTIIATIFIPLTFIAGIYGMNFKYMPELQWPYGYFTILSFMGIIFIGMLFYFREKKWI